MNNYVADTMAIVLWIENHKIPTPSNKLSEN